MAEDVVQIARYAFSFGYGGELFDFLVRHT